LGKIKRFEDIQVWQKARELTKQLYKITKNAQFAKDFSLRGQVRRAAISVISNDLRIFKLFSKTSKGGRELRVKRLDD